MIDAQLPVADAVMPRAASRRDVIVSNGLNRFHLAVAAEELARAGRLSLLLTGGYPTRRLAAAARRLRLDRSARVARLLDRRTGIAEADIAPFWRSEILGQLAGVARSRRAERVAYRLDERAMTVYGRRAARVVRRRSPGSRVYHYRSGFGLESVGEAKRAGLFALCDHSIAHPLSLGPLLGTPETPLSRPWQVVLRDLAQADRVLVNSDFVRSTFVDQGWEAERIDVIYLGIDDAFLAMVPQPQPQPPPASARRELRILFAGSFEHRKGGDTLAAALASLDNVPWRLDLAGAVPPQAAETHRALLDDPRVSVLGVVPRPSLPQVMVAADVFVFPSRAEGSARVVFEALACGRYVITTPQAGSIVVDGIHGALVEPGDWEGTAAALRAVWVDPERAYEIGTRNAALIRAHFRQSDYGDALLALYARIGGRDS